MVSIRRRRLLGLCCGPNGYVTPLPFLTVEEMITGIPYQNLDPTKTFKHPLHEEKIEPITVISPVDSGSILVKSEQNLSVSDQPLKRRKRHRRKQVEDQEACLMRGVYYKNMKWQAAIKVDKRQIHLGTFSSQEEAARLYDRAAFMCGREPNFDLSEEDKRELKGQSWDEFLACTRRTISNKKSKRTIEEENGYRVKKEMNCNGMWCSIEEDSQHL